MHQVALRPFHRSKFEMATVLAAEVWDETICDNGSKNASSKNSSSTTYHQTFYDATSRNDVTKEMSPMHKDILCMNLSVLHGNMSRLQAF